MKQGFKKYFFVVMVAVFLSSCAMSRGKNFDSLYVDKIERGVTTKADIRKNIGEPHSVTVSSFGDSWSYQYLRGPNLIQIYGNMLGADNSGGENKSLTIIFSGNVVKDYTLSESQ